MNCKPGDLAVVVGCGRGKERYLGRIYTVSHWVDDYYQWQLVERSELGGKLCCKDCDLRPIRPDETPEQSTEAMKLLTQTTTKEPA